MCLDFASTGALEYYSNAAPDGTEVSFTPIFVFSFSPKEDSECLTLDQMQAGTRRVIPLTNPIVFVKVFQDNISTVLGNVNGADGIYST